MEIDRKMLNKLKRSNKNGKPMIFKAVPDGGISVDIDAIEMPRRMKNRLKQGKGVKVYATEQSGGIIPLIPVILGAIGAVAGMAGSIAGAVKAGREENAKKMEFAMQQAKIAEENRKQQAEFKRQADEGLAKEQSILNNLQKKGKGLRQMRDTFDEAGKSMLTPSPELFNKRGRGLNPSGIYTYVPRSAVMKGIGFYSNVSGAVRY